MDAFVFREVIAKMIDEKYKVWRIKSLAGSIILQPAWLDYIVSRRKHAGATNSDNLPS